MASARKHLEFLLKLSDNGAALVLTLFANVLANIRRLLTLTANGESDSVNGDNDRLFLSPSMTHKRSFVQYRHASQ
ncbi:hypothetical protein CJE62_21375 [Salmonella enterica]|nr:hypothetical protein [Salmonella enterica]EDT6888524.1 hypothetical protein [Salmonella enterica subsp. enterica]EJU5353418.1 hypothetical protein [Salmonella enterica]